MTHDHSFQLFSLCHSKIQTQTNCKEVWPCSTQCIFHCLGGDDAIIYRIDCRCVEKVRVPPCWAAYLSLDESLKNGLSNLQGCDKVVLGTRIGTINKIRKIHQDLYEIKVYILQGLAIHLASSLQEDTKTNPKLTAAMAEHSMLHASVAISLPFELSPWNWLKYIDCIDIDFGIKHLAQCEPFYQFILQNCYNLCPQLAKNLNLELSNKSPSVHKRNVLGFFWARKFFGRSCSRLPTVSTIIGVRFSSKSWKQFCVSSKTEHGQWRTHSSTEENHARHQLPPHHSMHVGDKSNDKGLHIFCGKGFWTNLTTTSGWRAPALLATEGKPNCSELVWYSIQLYI